MTEQDLLKALKYYHNEEEPPQELSILQRVWWQGEKSLKDGIERDKEYFSRLVKLFDETKQDGNLSGRLVDESTPKEQRIIIFYLDIWHGKNYPFDDLDLINEY